MTPFDITLAVSILVLAGYVIAGIRLFASSHTYEQFFLADRSLTTENVRNTFTGAAISISTVLSFFLTLGVFFGYQIFWSPATLALGVLFFAHVIYPRLRRVDGLWSALVGEGDRKIDSLPDLVAFIYGGRAVTVIVAVLSGLGVLAVLVAEMMVGVSIYDRYFISPEYVVFIIAATLFLYAGFGGMAAVVETDRWQVRLIVISLLVVVGTLFLQERWLPDPQPSPGFHDLLGRDTWEPAFQMPLALYANILIVNLCFLPSSLRVWQVVVASTKRARFQRGLWEATALIVVVSLASLVISRVISGRLDGEITLPVIFAFLADSPDAFSAYVVYPLFIVAMLSALVSTADSAIIPLAQLMSGRKAVSWARGRSWLSIAVLVAGSVALYFLVTETFGLGLVPWILTVFSVTTCIAPAILAPLFFHPRVFPWISLRSIEFGMLLGCGVAGWWSIRFGAPDQIGIQAWNCVVGFSIATVFTALAYWIAPKSGVSAGEAS